MHIAHGALDRRPVCAVDCNHGGTTADLRERNAL